MQEENPMQQFADEKPATFVDRRENANPAWPGRIERRQFSDATRSDRPEVKELADAVDQYKLRHRRRFVTFEELYDVMVSLGYHK